MSIIAVAAPGYAGKFSAGASTEGAVALLIINTLKVRTAERLGEALAAVGPQFVSAWTNPEGLRDRTDPGDSFATRHVGPFGPSTSNDVQSDFAYFEYTTGGIAQRRAEASCAIGALDAAILGNTEHPAFVGKGRPDALAIVQALSAAARTELALEAAL